MNYVHEWDDVLLHFDLRDFLEILTKVVSQCCLHTYPHYILLIN